MVSQSRAAASSAIAALTWELRLSQTTTSGAGELLVRGVQELGVAGLGEPFALVLAAAAALVHAVDQPAPAARLDSDQRGQRDALVAAAGHPHHGSLAAAAPGAALGRPQALAGVSDLFICT